MIEREGAGERVLEVAIERGRRRERLEQGRRRVVAGILSHERRADELVVAAIIEVRELWGLVGGPARTASEEVERQLEAARRNLGLALGAATTFEERGVVSWALNAETGRGRPAMSGLIDPPIKGAPSVNGTRHLAPVSARRGRTLRAQ